MRKTTSTRTPGTASRGSLFDSREPELHEQGLGLNPAQRVEQKGQLDGIEKYRIRVWPQASSSSG